MKWALAAYLLLIVAILWADHTGAIDRWIEDHSRLYLWDF